MNETLPLSYSAYVYKVLKQVCTDMGISLKAVSIMNSSLYRTLKVCLRQGLPPELLHKVLKCQPQGDLNSLVLAAHKGG